MINERNKKEIPICMGFTRNDYGDRRISVTMQTLLRADELKQSGDIDEEATGICLVEVSKMVASLLNEIENQHRRNKDSLDNVIDIATFGQAFSFTLSSGISRLVDYLVTAETFPHFAEDRRKMEHMRGTYCAMLINDFVSQIAGHAAGCCDMHDTAFRLGFASGIKNDNRLHQFMPVPEDVADEIMEMMDEHGKVKAH